MPINHENISRSFSASGVGPVVGLYLDMIPKRIYDIWNVPLDNRKWTQSHLWNTWGQSFKKIDEPTVHIDDWQILRLGNHFRTFGYTVKMHVYNYVFAQAKQESIDL